MWCAFRACRSITPSCYMTPLKPKGRFPLLPTTPTPPKNPPRSLTTAPDALFPFPQTSISLAAAWMFTRFTGMGVTERIGFKCEMLRCDPTGRCEAPGRFSVGFFRNDSEALASGIAGIQIVPELDVRFVLFPAEKNLLVPEEGREINQAAFQVLDMNLPLLKFVQSFFDVRHRFHPVVDRVAAGISPAGKHAGQPPVVAVELFARFGKPLQPLADLRQERARLVARVVLLELISHVLLRWPRAGRRRLEFPFDLFARLQLDGLAPGLPRLVELLQSAIDIAQVIVQSGVGFLRMLNGLLQPTQRLARLSAFEQHPTHAVQESRVL